MPHQYGMGWHCTFIHDTQYEQQTSILPSLQVTKSQHTGMASGDLMQKKECACM